MMNAREREIKLGWTIVSGILGMVLLLLLTSVMLRVLAGLPLGLGQFVGFGLRLWLAWLSYQGRGWARAVLIVLLLLAACGLC